MNVLPFVLVGLFALLTSTASAQQETPPSPRYLAAMQSEFSSLGIDASCSVSSASRAQCEYSYRGQRSQRDFPMHIVYSDETDSVYIYVDRYLLAPPEAPGTDALLRRLMVYNWQMLAGKFEWDETDGEVRLSVVFHTDSNFDRRAFRSLIRAMALQADAYYGELSSLASTPPEATEASDTSPN
jgi:hypothetical protein